MSNFVCVCVCVTLITIYNMIYNMRHHRKVSVVAVAMSTASDVVEQIKGVSSMWKVFNDVIIIIILLYYYLFSV